MPERNRGAIEERIDIFPRSPPMERRCRWRTVIGPAVPKILADIAERTL
jgi:hypothetical protein